MKIAENNKQRRNNKIATAKLKLNCYLLLFNK